MARLSGDAMSAPVLGIDWFASPAAVAPPAAVDADPGVADGPEAAAEGARTPGLAAAV
jgi:hypothetical protein